MNYIELIKTVCLILLISNFNITITIEPYGPTATYGTHVEPYNICDREYAAGMRIAREELFSLEMPQPRGTIRSNVIPIAQRYMIMLKKHQDIEYKIKYFEDRVFESKTVAELGRPMQLYSKCLSDILGYNTALTYNIPTEESITNKLNQQILSGQPMRGQTRCDLFYQQEMERTLNYLKSKLDINLLKQAEQYMVMWKQYQDLKYNLQMIELNVLSIDIVARLRLPLLAYTRCQRSMLTKSYSFNVNR